MFPSADQCNQSGLCRESGSGFTQLPKLDTCCKRCITMKIKDNPARLVNTDLAGQPHDQKYSISDVQIGMTFCILLLRTFPRGLITKYFAVMKY